MLILRITVSVATARTAVWLTITGDLVGRAAGLPHGGVRIPALAGLLVVPNGCGPLRAAEIAELNDELIGRKGRKPTGDRLRALLNTACSSIRPTVCRSVTFRQV